MVNKLTRTDTKEVTYSLIRNKYDKPQKNSRKIKWDDKKLMPSPSNRIKKSTLKRENFPYPKKFKKY